MPKVESGHSVLPALDWAVARRPFRSSRFPKLLTVQSTSNLSHLASRCRLQSPCTFLTCFSASSPAQKYTCVMPRARCKLRTCTAYLGKCCIRLTNWRFRARRCRFKTNCPPTSKVKYPESFSACAAELGIFCSADAGSNSPRSRPLAGQIAHGSGN